MMAPVSGLWAAAVGALSLSTLLTGVVGQKPASHFFVESLPGQPDGPLLRQHAGHLDVDNSHHGKMFFWRFENRHIADKHRTVFWLNGGPGCSSEDGALMEVGPYRLKDAENLEYNKGSWDQFANLVFVDNPVGTGFSSIDSDSYLHELGVMADQFNVFLDKYFAVFPEDRLNDIYIAGESYAGQHIPYIAAAISKHNRQSTSSQQWNLKGILIGNGWISPKDQGPAYLAYAYKAGLVDEGSTIAAELERQQDACITAMESVAPDDWHISYSSCEAILNQLLEKTASGGQCYNMYDVRLKDSYPACGMNWPPDLADVTPYLQREDVVRALHVDEDSLPGWTECNGNVGNAFHPHKSPPAILLLADILKEIPVLLFSGEQDLICNHLGTESMISNFDWNGGHGFEIEDNVYAPRREWTFEGQLAGFYQEARNLTYVLFYDASHMVPFDWPERSRDMLHRFMGVDTSSAGAAFSDNSKSTLDGEKPVTDSSASSSSSSSSTSSSSSSESSESMTADEVEEQRLQDERWSAYYRSGAVALVVVAILATCFGWYVWQDRRRRAGYKHVALNDSFVRRDVEVADFDEGELDDLASPDDGDHKYSLGDDSDDDEGRKTNGHGNGHMK